MHVGRHERRAPLRRDGLSWNRPCRYTEQYVLPALLWHSDRYHTVFATHYMSRTHPEPMRRSISVDVGRCFGSSYWFSVGARSPLPDGGSSAA